MTCSAACWARFCQVLAAQYGDPERMQFHQLLVDSYAVQHPGTFGERRAVQSVGIHLMTLCLFLEQGTDPALGAGLHRRMVQRPVFHALPAPALRGDITAADLPLAGPADQVEGAAYDWASCAWSAWSDHHETVRGWLATAGLLRPGTAARRS